MKHELPLQETNKQRNLVGLFECVPLIIFPGQTRQGFVSILHIVGDDVRRKTAQKMGGMLPTNSLLVAPREGLESRLQPAGCRHFQEV